MLSTETEPRVNFDKPVAAPTCKACDDRRWRFVEGGGMGAYAPCDCNQEILLQRDCRTAGMPADYIGKRLDAYAPADPAEKSALQQAMAWFRQADKTKALPTRGMLYHGVPGCGKTEFACMVMRAVMKRRYTVRFANVPQLFLTLRDSMRDDAETHELDLVQRLVAPALLVLDDLCAAKPSEYVQNTLYVVLNERSNRNKAVVITSDFTGAKQAEVLGERIASRIAAMTQPVKLSDRDYRLRNGRRVA